MKKTATNTTDSNLRNKAAGDGEESSMQRMGSRRVPARPKQETAWAIYSGEILLPFTVRSTRTETIREIERCYGVPWRKSKKRGCSIAKVSVQPVGPADSNKEAK